MKKARAGLCLLYEKWFRLYCDDPRNEEQGRELKEYIDKDTAAVVAELEPHFDLVFPGAMACVEDAASILKAFHEADIDMLIVVSLFWSGDKPLLRILESFAHLPVVLWVYSPHRTLPEHMKMNDLFRAGGVVGAVQTSAPLCKLKKKISYVFGSPGDEELKKELYEYGKAFAAKKNLRGLRLGHICGRYEEMTGTYADEFFLLAKIGVERVPLSSYRLYQSAQALGDDEIMAYIKDITGRCEKVSVSEKALYYAARASLAVGKLAEEENLGAIALEDFNDEMHGLLKTRPQLWIPCFDKLRLVPSMEGDVLASLALCLSTYLGESLPMYTEMFAFDQERNGVLMGHASMNCPSIAGENPLSIIPDAECGALCETEGAWLHFKGRPGNVTVAGLFDTGGGNYRVTLFQGVAQYSDLLDTSPNVFVRLSTPLRDFYRNLISAGMTQHFALSYDTTITAWKKLCEIMEWECLHC